MSMIKKLLRLVVAVLAASSLPVAAFEQDAPSRDLVEKIVQAYGGAQLIERMTALSAEGEIDAFARGTHGTYKRFFQRPRLLRVETSYPGMTETRVLNGQLAWRVNDLEVIKGDTGPSRQAMIYQYKQLDLPFGLLKGRYNLRFAGEEAVSDQLTQVLEVWDDEGPAMRVNVDTTAHFIVKVTGVLQSGAKTMSLSAEFSDFRLIDGTPLPFHINHFAAGIAISETVITRYALNPVLSSDLFVPRIKGRESARGHSGGVLAAVMPTLSAATSEH